MPPYKGPEGPVGKLPDGNLLAYFLWDKGLTAWDFILNEDEQERTWYDVEECTRAWVNYRGSESSCAEHLAEICSLPDHPHKSLTPFLSGEESTLFFARDLYQLNHQSPFFIDTILPVLLNELHRLEHAFSVYLLDQMREMPGYSEKFLQLLTELVTEQPLHEWMKSTTAQQRRKLFESVSVLNFNYTRPILPAEDRGPSMLNIPWAGKNRQHHLRHGREESETATTLLQQYDKIH